MCISERSPLSLSISESSAPSSWILDGDSRPCALDGLSHSLGYFYFCPSIISLGNCPFIPPYVVCVTISGPGWAHDLGLVSESAAFLSHGD